MRLHIYRSENIDLFRKGKDFCEMSKKLCSAVTGCYSADDMKTILGRKRWYCTDCRLGRDAASSSSPRRPSRSIHREALCCRSVIRRLAVEWYARPFLDENQGKGQKANAASSSLPRAQEYHVSLRRLDGMFCAIMEKSANHDNSNATDTSTDATRSTDATDSEISPFFFLPPWSVPGRTRLEWAPVELEQDPFRLLCKGMELLLTSPSDASDSDDLHKQRRELARHFLPLFSSYCLDSSANWASTQASSSGEAAPGSPLVRGPPDTVVRLCPPFLHKPCNCCGVRASKQDDGLEGFCSEQCRRAFYDGWLIYRTHSNSIEAPPEATRNDAQISSSAQKKCQAYDVNSSIVGSTILALPGDPLLDLLWAQLGVRTVLRFYFTVSRWTIFYSGRLDST